MKRDIVADFNEMKNNGINSIKIYGSGIYNYNVFSAARQAGLHIHYSFWIDEKTDFTNKDQAGQLLKNILKQVTRLKEQTPLIGWNIGNTVYNKLETIYEKPLLLYHRQAYIR